MSEKEVHKRKASDPRMWVQLNLNTHTHKKSYSIRCSCSCWRAFSLVWQSTGIPSAEGLLETADCLSICWLAPWFRLENMMDEEGSHGNRPSISTEYRCPCVSCCPAEATPATNPRRMSYVKAWICNHIAKFSFLLPHLLPFPLYLCISFLWQQWSYFSLLP